MCILFISHDVVKSPEEVACSHAVVVRVGGRNEERSPKADTSESALMMVALSFIISRLKACRTSPSAALIIGVCRHCSRTAALTETMEVGMRQTVLR